MGQSYELACAIECIIQTLPGDKTNPGRLMIVPKEPFFKGTQNYGILGHKSSPIIASNIGYNSQTFLVKRRHRQSEIFSPFWPTLSPTPVF